MHCIFNCKLGYAFLARPNAIALHFAIAIVPLMPEGRGHELEENVATTS
jgi:hypothetical protein